MVDSLSKGLAEGNDLQASLKMVSRGGNFLSVYLGQPDKTFTNFLQIPSGWLRSNGAPMVQSGDGGKKADCHICLYGS
jgi:hypothetical protein